MRVLMAKGWRVAVCGHKKTFISPAGLNYDSLPKIAVAFPHLVPEDLIPKA